MNFIGKKIRSVRLMLDIQSQVFAKSIGMKQSALSALESGRNQPTYNTLFNIIHVYGVPPVYFFQETYRIKLVDGIFSLDYETIFSDVRLLDELARMKERLDLAHQNLSTKDTKVVADRKINKPHHIGTKRMTESKQDQ